MPAGTDLPVLIGIDVGTSSVRAIAFDARGRKIATAAHPTPMTVVATGGEFDPDRMFDAALGALTEVATALAGRPVAGIAVASMGESCILIDDAGRSLAPSITWYDRRTAAEARAVTTIAGADRVFAVSGHAVDLIFTLTKLMWMREHWPEADTRARHVLMMADWIAFRLSGEAATDPTLASRTLYFDIRSHAWSPEMLALADRDERFPAPLAASGTALGPLRPEIARATGLALAGKPVIAVGGHDHIIGAFAAGLNRPGTVVNSIGTAEALLLATPEPLADPEVIRRGYVQGAIAADRRMSYIAGSLHSAGGSIEWLRRMVGDLPQDQLIAEAATIPPGSNGVVFLPHLANGPPPDPDLDGRGAFVGLTPVATPAALYRAVMEGVALQSRMMLDGMTGLPDVGEPTEIRLIGGVSRNRLFLSLKANAFNRPLVVIDEPETTALGAALLGGVGAGVFPDLDAALASLDQHTFVVEPDDTAATYERLRTMVFENIHDRLKPINRGLAEFLRLAGGAPD